MPRSPSAPRISWIRRATTAGSRKSCTRSAKPISRNTESPRSARASHPRITRARPQHSRQRNDRGHDRAAGTRTAHVPAAAERGDPVAHGCEAVGCNGLEPIRRDSFAVVRDAQDKGIAIDADDQVRGLGLRMLEDVRQGFLGDTEDAYGGIWIEFGLGIGNRFRAPESGAAAGLFELPAQRREQAHVVDQGVSELLDYAALQIHSRTQRFVDALEALFDGRIAGGQPLLKPG